MSESPLQPEQPALAATTAMFVEVLVIGIGFLSGVALLATAAAGPRDAAELARLADSTLLAGTALATAYAFGILVDRIADKALSPIRRHLRRTHFPTEYDYAQARLRLAAQPTLAARADYARSRLRICRGWILNSTLMTIAACTALQRFPLTQRTLLTTSTTAFGLLATAGFYYAWHTITATGYRKLAEQTAPPAAAVPAPPRPPAPANTAPR